MNKEIGNAYTKKSSNAFPSCINRGILTGLHYSELTSGSYNAVVYDAYYCTILQVPRLHCEKLCFPPKQFVHNLAFFTKSNSC